MNINKTSSQKVLHSIDINPNNTESIPSKEAYQNLVACMTNYPNTPCKLNKKLPINDNNSITIQNNKSLLTNRSSNHLVNSF